MNHRQDAPDARARARAQVQVEVVLAEAERAVIRTYIVREGTTLAEVLLLAAADREFAGLDVATTQVGVFGIRVPPGTTISDGDRVEFYRNLPNDPKLARRARALKARRKP